MPGAVAIEQYQVVGGVIAAKTKLATATACSALWVVAQTTQPVRADAPRGHQGGHSGCDGRGGMTSLGSHREKTGPRGVRSSGSGIS